MSERGFRDELMRQRFAAAMEAALTAAGPDSVRSWSEGDGSGKDLGVLGKTLRWRLQRVISPQWRYPRCSLEVVRLDDDARHAGLLALGDGELVFHDRGLGGVASEMIDWLERLADRLPGLPHSSQSADLAADHAACCPVWRRGPAMHQAGLPGGSGDRALDA